MNTLPTEIIHQIYLHLDPSDIFNIGRVFLQSLKYQHRSNIIKTKDFWDWYIKHKYFIHSYPEMFDPMYIAAQSEQLLEKLYKKDVYMPTYALECVFKYIYPHWDPSDYIYVLDSQNGLVNIVQDCYESNSCNDQIANECLTYVIQKLNLNIVLPHIEDTPRVRQHSIFNIYHEFTKEDECFYRCILKYVTIPTQYFTPEGIITIKFNPDVINIVAHLELVQEHVEGLYDRIYNNISTIEYARYVQHFNFN